MLRHFPTLLMVLGLAAPWATAPMPAQEPATESAAAATFDHQYGAWTALLAKHVHPGGRVHYRGLAKDRAAFDAVITTFEKVSRKDYDRWTPDQKYAYWVNAYNAYAIQLILDHYPVESIKDLGGVFSSVFSKRFIPLQSLIGQSKKLSLGEVEHEILFGLKQGPMFHFAIVCASTSCPELRASAYTANNIRAELAAQARHFLADPTKNSQRPTDGKLRVSKIFDWAEDEFATYKGGVQGLLRDYGPPAVSEALSQGRLKLKFLSYDWSLNEWLPPKSSRL